jgi:hypothetical protein
MDPGLTGSKLIFTQRIFDTSPEFAIFDSLIVGLRIIIEPGYINSDSFIPRIIVLKYILWINFLMFEGTDVTAVSYGWNVHNTLKAAYLLKEIKYISVEVIDIQILLSFDVKHLILESVKKNQQGDFH